MVSGILLVEYLRRSASRWSNLLIRDGSRTIFVYRDWLFEDEGGGLDEGGGDDVVVAPEVVEYLLVRFA